MAAYAAVTSPDGWVPCGTADEVTDAMHLICDDVGEEDDFLTAAARHTLHRAEW